MADELVVEAQRGVHDSFVAHQDEVVEPAAGRQPHALERLDLLDEAERPRRGDLVREGGGAGQAEGVFLAADRCRVLEEVAHLEAVARLDPDPLLVGVVGADPVALFDHQLLDRRALLLDAGLGEELAELLGRAVEDRDLGVHLHEQVRDAVRVQRSHQVLDGLRDHPATDERRRVAGRIDPVDQRGHRLAGRDAFEHDAAAGRHRLQDQARADARVQTLAVHDDALADRALGDAPRRGHARRRRDRRGAGHDYRLFGDAAQRAVDHPEERIQLERLLQEVERPHADHAHRGVDRSVAGDHDDRDLGRLLAHARDELDAVDLGHPDVHDREVRQLLLEQLERPPAVRRLHHFVPLVRQHAAQRVPDVGLVIHHQDRVRHPYPLHA